ncbi:MAG: hypothetical protein ABSC11_00485, partial [Smithella sp.]
SPGFRVDFKWLLLDFRRIQPTSSDFKTGKEECCLNSFTIKVIIGTGQNWNLISLVNGSELHADSHTPIWSMDSLILSELPDQFIAGSY